MTYKHRSTRRLLLGATALVGALALNAAQASAQERRYDFDVPAQPLNAALQTFARQAQLQVIFAEAETKSLRAPPLNGNYSADEALQVLLAGTELKVSRTSKGVLQIAANADPQSESAAGDGADQGTVQALIVTAQKREEQIQDVPIAISAFTEKSLQEQKIEGGFDLLKAIPNVTFSKNNFTSYNFSIRGIGTKAVSATTDPGVAVAFNNTALIVNRLFEQEYFDVERVEVLRGPQGTLYGRNATAGVINVISAKPNLHEFDGWIKGEVGNYHTKRVSAMVNVPLVEDKLAIRFAGALTDRQGYDYNSVTKHQINGRDLWSGRITVAFNPTPKFRSNFIWERFNENDDRSRTGKQLCHHDDGPDVIGSTPVADDPTNPVSSNMRHALFSQGCKPGSLYDASAFGTPNGLALPFVLAMAVNGNDCGDGCNAIYPLGYDRNGLPTSLVKVIDPYGGLMQSSDLRTIASFRDPKYRATADVFELNLDFDLTDSLTLTSQTAYDKDTVYSFQDYNRFNTLPLFNDTSGLSASRDFDGNGGYIQAGGPSKWANLAPGGILCDPQLGCSNTLAGFDISQAKSRQFSQEVRLQSNFQGRVNFSAGVNYTRFQTLVDYYVMYNLITAFAETMPFNAQGDPTKCYIGFGITVPIDDPRAKCPYIDPNPVESINGEGHNYFRSKNPYKLKSAAAFGEIYWQLSDEIKLTAGLRYTDDKKTFIPVPSQILLDKAFIFGGGTVNRGYPEKPAIKQHWGEFTGRLGVDWKPKLSFTDQTMLYAFYSRGYKGGGANPPTPGFATAEESIKLLDIPPDLAEIYTQVGILPNLQLTGVEYGATFKPEFVNAFEIGAKNTLLGGALQFNTDAFFYDYKDYQVSQIRDRTAVNENFDARVWGLEFETVFSASRNLQVVANLGFLDSRIGKGMKSIDIMNRTQGDPRFVLAKPWVQLPSNCVVPVGVAENWLQNNQYAVGYWRICGGFNSPTFLRPIDPNTGEPYDVNNYPELNGGAGVAADLSGNELPNSPHWTTNIGIKYGFDVLQDWRVTARADAYWQSQSWARVYNDNPYDKLHGWYNVNLSVWLERPEDDLKIEFYAKNLLDKTPITDAFLNSDDTDLTTNVFVLDPRLIGLSIRKGF